MSKITANNVETTTYHVYKCTTSIAHLAQWHTLERRWQRGLERTEASWQRLRPWTPRTLLVPPAQDIHQAKAETRLATNYPPQKRGISHLRLNTKSRCGLGPCYSTPTTLHEASGTSTRVVRPHRGLQRTNLRRTSVTVTVGARKKIPLTPYTTMPPNKNRTWPSYAAMLAVLIITPRWPSSSASFSTILLVARVYACMRVGERNVLSTENKMLCRQLSPYNGSNITLL